MSINVPQMIITNIDGRVNDVVIGEYAEDIYMMKFNEVKIVNMIRKEKTIK